MNVSEIQEALRREGMDGWLFFDHHGRDPLAYRVLGISPATHCTRRWYYFIPAQGEPRGLVHRIESGMLDTVPGEKVRYSSWTEQTGGLKRAAGRRAARGDAVLAALRDSVRRDGGCGDGGTGARAGRGGGDLGGADPAFRSAMECRGAGIASGSGAAGGSGARARRSE